MATDTGRCEDIATMFAPHNPRSLTMATSNRERHMAEAMPADSSCDRRARRKLTRHLAVAVLASACIAIAPIISAGEFPGVIVLPGATSAEGVAMGEGTTFYAGDFLTGDIYRGNLQTGHVELFIDAPEGRMAAGLKADISRGLLFVAGGFTGQAYVYDLKTGAALAKFQLGVLVNDVVITHDAAWFTDSALPHLYKVPIAPGGSAETLVVSGPAAELFGFPNL